MSRDDEEEFEHPSYGMIAANRSLNANTTRLFGSPLDRHYSTVRISIGTGKRIHSLNYDRYHGSLRGEHIEVEMSALQFAELVTSMNQGSGVPCTIRYIAGERIEDPPKVDTETEKIHRDFAKTFDRFSDRARECAKEIVELTQKLPAKSRERIRIALEGISSQMANNAPFVLRQFEEASTRVVSAAKHEIDAFAMHMRLNPGLAGSLMASDAAPALSAPAKVEESIEDATVIEPIPTVEEIRTTILQSGNQTKIFAAEQYAKAIDLYLKRFALIVEADGSAICFHPHACATNKGNVEIAYKSYQGVSILTNEEAERYLLKLEANFVGRHFEALR